MAEINDEEMFSMSYKDARDKYGVGTGGNKYFMSESDFNKGKERINKKNAEKPAAENKPKEENPKKEQSLVAKQFGPKKEKTYDDVLRENGNDPAKMADWLNNNPEYKAGNKTRQGMEGFGYIQGDDGKWAPKPKEKTPTTTTETTTTETTTTTNDAALNGVESITKEDPKAGAFVNGITNGDGSVNEQKAYNAMSQYEQKLVEMGAGSFDEDGKFVFKDTTKKGWEDWATMLSVGASVIGIAMGVPIIPINFRKITNKDEKDAKIREFQKQYTDIMAGNAAKVKDVESSAEAGKLAKANEDDINAYSKYKEDVGAYKAKSDIDTDSQKDIIDKNLEAEMTLSQAAFENEVKKMNISHQQQKDLQTLLSNLSTNSAKTLLNQERFGWLLDSVKAAEDAGLDERAIALNIQAWAGSTATAQNLKHAESIVGMITNLIDSASNLIPGNGK